MKAFLICWAVGTIAILCLYIVYSAKRIQEAVSKKVILMCVSLSLCLLTRLLTFVSTDIKFVTAIFSLYYTLKLWVLFSVFQFSISIITQSKNAKSAAFSKYLFFSLAAIDFVNYFINIFTNHIFIINPVFYENGVLHYWSFKFLLPFYYHLSLSIITILQTSINLFVRSYHMPKFYRKKYYSLGILLLIFVIVNEFFRRKNCGYNYSMCLDIFISSYIFYIAYLGLNRDLLNALLLSVSENISYAIVCFDEKEKCFYLNQQARTIFGQGKTRFASAEGYKDKLKRQFPEKMFDFISLTQSLLIGEKVHSYECEYRIIRDKKQRQIVSYIKLDDITEELELLEQEKYRTEHDSLTDLYNRNAFFKYAAETLHENQEISFLLIATDIMDFKVINSLFSEEIGDGILKLFAEKISMVKYPNKICGRISGDKFAILIPKEDFNAEEFLSNNMQLQQAVKKYNFRIKNYIGVYEISDHFENVKTMFDKAMLTIQTIRGNLEKTIAYYDMPLMEKMLKDRHIISDFEHALSNGEFTIYLHPQVKAENSSIMGAEALVRWVSPTGLKMPSEFIPLLEQAGLIHKLDQYVWELAAKKLAEWKSIGNEMYISINISAKDFYYCDVYKFLTDLVEKYNIEPQKLNIEITETVLMQNVETHRSILQKLREYGFTIEMDDFGSGYSSLNTLKNLEMNILKIDMDFLRGWKNSKKDKSIISSIITMAKTLGMTVVSEGVETEEQAKFLKDVGCDIFQGFFFSKPIPLGEFEKLYVNGGYQIGHY